jgi:phosphoribosylformylglycinamidine (FGAM) synthase-like amidotransferase family enzyme
LRYCSPDGQVDAANRASNPNGSERAIAGICNKAGNVMALMPHPERCAEAVLGNEDGLEFRCDWVDLAVERADTPFTHRYEPGQRVRMPIAHGEGRYFDLGPKLDALERNEQVVFRYCSPAGEVDGANRQWNPNGAERAIAGICNKAGNVMALMPHPERCAEAILGNQDGLEIFRSLVDSVAGEAGARRRRAGAR